MFTWWSENLHQIRNLLFLHLLRCFMVEGLHVGYLFRAIVVQDCTDDPTNRMREFLNGSCSDVFMPPIFPIRCKVSNRLNDNRTESKFMVVRRANLPNRCVCLCASAPTSVVLLYLLVLCLLKISARKFLTLRWTPERHAFWRLKRLKIDHSRPKIIW